MKRVEEIWEMLLIHGELDARHVALTYGLSIASVLTYFSEVVKRYPNAERHGDKLILKSCLCLEGKEAAAWVTAAADYLNVELDEVAGFRYHGDSIDLILPGEKVVNVKLDEIEDIRYCRSSETEITNTRQAIWVELCDVEDKEKRKELFRKLLEMINELESIFPTNDIKDYSSWIDVFIVFGDGSVKMLEPDAFFLERIDKKKRKKVLKKAREIYEKYFPSS